MGVTGLKQLVDWLSDSGADGAAKAVVEEGFDANTNKCRTVAVKSCGWRLPAPGDAAARSLLPETCPPRIPAPFIATAVAVA